MNSDPAFKVTTFLKSNILQVISVLKTKLLLHNRKVYVTYGMVVCLVTWTDLQTHHAGLSASADLLVTVLFFNIFYNFNFDHDFYTGYLSVALHSFSCACFF